ncbi:late competence development ComFB family protein [Oribacterium sp. WCC10]|uniref:late competence development ComFB family protein n=1 Tax=Oribacterium sp. WCC10 TaxID=1855343 RepID=UPI0008EF4DB0|nr:late competence development ComFB family protein [Oribacterium sp. WCC10]SFG24671.1 Late competence development protein ComFB [Oribacterium sp. WCC10]
MGTETFDDKKGTFESIGEAADFAENIAATIRQGLKDAKKAKKEAKAKEIEDINAMISGNPEKNSQNMQERLLGELDPDGETKSKGKKGKRVVPGGYGNNYSYGLDNIGLRNEVVKEKRRAIRVESDEDRDVISDAIQKRLEEKVFGEAKVQEGFHIVNIMQECLKSENILAYMKNQGCCTCERCQADVLAATLSHLPAKYVVMYKKSTSARISFYHDSYRMDILAAIMRAIRAVKEHPHHGDDRMQ